jgi:hypothetical protein
MLQFIPNSSSCVYLLENSSDSGSANQKPHNDGEKDEGVSKLVWGPK